MTARPNAAATDTPPRDDTAPPIPVLPLALGWRPRGHKPGAHAAAGDGGDGRFHSLAPLLARPDPRRIDIRASIRDPFEAVHVRTFAPRRAVTVTALVDLSGSMGCAGLAGAVARLVATCAASAIAGGDAFSLIAADAAPRPDLFIPASRRRGLAREVLHRLTHAPRAGRGATGLLAATEQIPRARGIVVLVSDFLMPQTELRALLDALHRHDVIPVVARSAAAEGALPRFGLIDLVDAETGARRLVFMRPGLRARWQAQAQARGRALDTLFASHGLAPFSLTDRFDPDALLDFLLHR
ncbi:hypothetical protein V5F53_09635 [Xanthobacter sp. V4C-4]|uniref:DUF58 domain-containing protein n=1 Tax=Xanthobacter cornucopiae TaxID=3119924 RepID=UPI0037283BA9